jgi:cell division protein FtsZ
LLEDISIGGAHGVLVNITASEDFGIQEMNDAIDLIQNQAHEDANIIVGLVHDATLDDEVRITVIATGVGDRAIDRVHARMETAARQAMIERSGEEHPHRPVHGSGHGSSHGSSHGSGHGGGQHPRAQARPRLMDDSYEEDDDMVEPEPEPPPRGARARRAPAQHSQEDFAFEDVLEDSRDESIDIPTYLRRWRSRGTRTRP